MCTAFMYSVAKIRIPWDPYGVLILLILHKTVFVIAFAADFLHVRRKLAGDLFGLSSRIIGFSDNSRSVVLLL